MFAYTGLKPEQMDTLAKEVRYIFPYSLMVSLLLFEFTLDNATY